jgi:hypothetical protein
MYVPFCGHAAIAELAGSPIRAPDPLADTLFARQPAAGFNAYVSGLIGDMAAMFAAP